MILRWLNSLNGRLTLFTLLAIVAAQAVGTFGIVQQEERTRATQNTQAFVRDIVGIVDVLNATPGLERRRYVETVRQPGLQYWLDSAPAVTDPHPVIAEEAPPVPFNWNAINSEDKRLIWYPDTRTFYDRYRIGRIGMRRPERPGVAFPPPAQTTDDTRSMYGPRTAPNERGPNERGPNERRRPRPRLRDSLGTTFEEPDRPEGPGGGLRPGPRPQPENPDAGGAAPPPPPPPPERALISGIEDFNRGPPAPGDEPKVRWRASVLLNNGQWLNAEHIYERGLPRWMATVLLENALVFALILSFVIPVIAVTTKRVKELAAAADRLGRGEDTEPLPESGASEIRQLTQAFNNMGLRLRRFVQGRTEMLAGISHDLRTPITALRLRADLIEDDNNRERMQALITDMQHLTEATLTLAKDESFTEKTDKVDLSTLIEGICDDLTDAGIDATADVQRGVILKCRPFSLRRAIRNLAENGAKYGQRAHIKMRVDGRNVLITIDDDGPGIPEDQMEKAFKPFVRLEGSRNRETGGSGLGLAITRSIVLNHGGELKLSNRPEGGLRAMLTLPREYDA